MSRYRDIITATDPGPALSTGRKVIAVIGIDHYQRWPHLANAVSDANGARSVFQQLGFEEVRAPLINEHATERAIHTLVTDELTSLDENDSLILFYAGHGGTRVQRVGDKTGYLVPVDAANESNRVATWIDLEDWLRRVSMLPPKHILVILDACHSGIALSWRNKPGREAASPEYLPLSALQARRSRVIITSALDDQIAHDSGPIPGHSLFTGCLIEGLTGGLAGIEQDGRWVTTGKDLGAYVRRRVLAHCDHRRHGRLQTPDFGPFDYDERGEMVIPLLLDVLATGHSPAGWRPAVAQATVPRPSVSPDATMPGGSPPPQHHDPRFTTSSQPANSYGRPPAMPQANPYGQQSAMPQTTLYGQQPGMPQVKPYAQPQQPAGYPEQGGYPQAANPYAQQQSSGGPLHDLGHKLPPSPPGRILGIPVSQFRDAGLQPKILFLSAVALIASIVVPVSISPLVFPWSGGGFSGFLWPLISGAAYLLLAATPQSMRDKVPPVVLQWIPFGVAYAGIFISHLGGLGVGSLYILGYSLLVFGLLARIAQPQDRFPGIVIAVGGACLIPTWIDTFKIFGLLNLFPILTIITLLLAFLVVTLGVFCIVFVVPPAKLAPARHTVDAFGPLIAAILIIWLPLMHVLLALANIVHPPHELVGSVLKLGHGLLPIFAYFGVLMMVSPAAYEEAKAIFARRGSGGGGGYPP